MDTSKRLFDELLELRPRIKVRRLPRHQMLNPACTFPARLWRCRTELHYKRTVARQGRFIVIHLLTPFLGSVSVTFPLPRVGEKYRETNGKGTQANGKDFGKEKPQTVKFAVRRGHEHGAGAPDCLRSTSLRPDH